jgi:hypothetical protein
MLLVGRSAYSGSVVHTHGRRLRRRSVPAQPVWHGKPPSAMDNEPRPGRGRLLWASAATRRCRGPTRRPGAASTGGHPAWPPNGRDRRGTSYGIDAPYRQARALVGRGQRASCSKRGWAPCPPPIMQRRRLLREL